MLGIEYIITGACFLFVAFIVSVYFEKMLFSPALLFFIVFFVHAYLDPIYRVGVDPHFNTNNLHIIKKVVVLANVMLLLGFSLVSFLFYQKRQLYYPMKPVLGRTGFHMVSVFTLGLFVMLFVVMIQIGLFSGLRGSLSHDRSYILAKAITYFFYSLLPALWLSFIVDKHKENRLIRKLFILVLFSLALLYSVATFGRQFILFLFLSCGMIYHTRVQRVKIKEIIFAVFAVLFVTIFALFRKLRTGFLEIRVADIIELFKSGSLNFEVILSSLVTTVPGQGVFSNTITLVDQSQNYQHGLTYLNSFLNAFIPNALAGDIAYETPARWYAKTYAPKTTNHGFDFSMFAEAYLNFGENAFYVFFFVGVICGFVSYLLRTSRSPVVIIWSAIMIVNLILGLRNDSVPLFTRGIFFIFPFIVVKYSTSILLRKNKRPLGNAYR